MFVVAILIFCIALVFTPFPPEQYPRKEEGGKDKKYGQLLSLIALRNPTHGRKNGDVKRESLFMRLKNRKKNADLGLVVAEVATRLRSGAQPEEAWYRSLKASYGNTCEKGLDEHGVPYGLRALWAKRSIVGKKSTDQTQLAIPAAIATCRLSYFSGAPVADVLDSCASGISEAAEAASARSVALAGPQTSAQMLAWLPLIGVVLGSVLGAKPLHFLLSTTAGRFVFVLGLVCEIAGIVWVRALCARAEKL